ncbi:fimbrial protein [Pantoea agglomerans]|uniref:fimbrial protein n=1 Tax=Enterobacter agglomerans TaxID=549 RepID=UPI003209E9BD
MRQVHRFSVLACWFIFLGADAGAAHPQGYGRVSMRGSIIDTACAIDTQSRDQTVDMGATPTGVIARDGHGAARSFTIRLVNCRLAQPDERGAGWRDVRATFEGLNHNGLFGLNGNTRGVALELTDRHGNIARPGEPLPTGELSAGNQQLDYTLRLVGDRQVLRAGDFRTILRFRMEYN